MSLVPIKMRFVVSIEVEERASCVPSHQGGEAGLDGEVYLDLLKAGLLQSLPG